MIQPWLLTLAQTVEESNLLPPETFDAHVLSLPIVLAIVGAAAVALGVYVVRNKLAKRSALRGFVGLVDQDGFEIVHDEDTLRLTAERVGELFGEQAIYARQLRLAGVLRRVDDDGLVIDAAQVSLGLEASNANINTLVKLVLIIHRPGMDLPEFSLLPNHFLFATVQKDPVFHHSGAFGRKNLVLGEDKYFIAHTISGRAREELADNGELVIESRDGLLAFYLHDERIQAKDLPAFVTRCLSLSRTMIDNAADYRPTPEAKRTTRHPLLQM